MTNSNNYILIIDINHLDLKSSGTKTYALQLINFFNKKKYNLKVAVEAPESCDLSWLEIVVSKYNILRIKNRPKIFNNNIIGIFFDLYVSYKLNLSSYDVVVISSGNNSKFWGVNGRKIVHIFHSIFKKKLSWKHFFLMFFLMLHKGKRKNYTVSNYASEQLFLNANNTVSKVIYNTCSPLCTINEDFKLPYEKNKFVVITIGQLVKYKGIENWFKVASSITKNNDDIMFFWVGDGPEYLKYKRLETDKIKFIGHKSNVSDYIKASSLLYHPSFNENHSLAILEAMSFGLPVVACSVGGNSESVVDSVNGYIVDVDDIASHEEKIMKILGDQTVFNQMSKHSVNIYESRFSYENWENRIEAALKE